MSLFAASGVLFWAGLLLWLLVMFIFIGNESWLGLLWFLALAVVLAIFYRDLGIWEWCREHPWKTLLMIPLYVVLGVGWAYPKWYFHVKNQMDDFVAHKGNYVIEWNEYNQGRQFPPVPFKDYLATRYDIPPSAAKNKDKIVFWMAWWPFSVVTTIINDPLRRLYNAIYAQLADSFDAISHRVFGGFDAVTKEK